MKNTLIMDDPVWVDLRYGTAVTDAVYLVSEHAGGHSAELALPLLMASKIIKAD